MKTTEIAAYIAERNPRLYVGSTRPFLPLLPFEGARTRQEVGWVAYNLIRCMEFCAGDSSLFFNPEKGLFGFYNMAFAIENLLPGGWVAVEWDGYGELESWKEVAG